MVDDPDCQQVLTILRTEGEAHILVNHLESIGIKAIVSGAGLTSWPEALNDYQVVVRRSDLERAKQELAGIPKG